MPLFSHWFEKAKLTEPVSFAALQTDMHSHLIPGIDDGVKTMEGALDLIRKLKHLGFSKLITTPHVMVDLYRNEREIIREGARKLNLAIAEAGLDITLEAAAEYKIDEGLPKLLEKGELLTFGDQFLLVELPYYSPPLDLRNQLFSLQSSGYQPVLAHPERYVYWHSEFNKLEELKNMGVFFQLNTISLSGYYSHPTKKISEKLIDAGMIDFLGSDVHNQRYFQLLEKAMMEPRLEKLLRSGQLMNHLI